MREICIRVDIVFVNFALSIKNGLDKKTGFEAILVVFFLYTVKQSMRFSDP